MKAVRLVFSTIAILFMLLLTIVSPAALTGLVIFLVGLYLSSQYHRSKTNFNKSGWVMAAGLFLSVALAAGFLSETAVEPEIEDTPQQEEQKDEELKAKEDENAKQEIQKQEKLAEEKAKEEEKKNRLKKKQD
ncbi:hypothetical protein [Cytobacillus sp. NCCP-133]|uniref:hypothetical protein n=1 Tax=Cytobacillus sp. NCCP-133 TaxID=766848 RepID=UPI0022308577|nr:hypothetical protein [Cytobacillus sp. NCCP-133]GLB60847.1 hypothetical protein NCCP133_29790 [Cytobacillus sp. NCCP-133]